MTIPRRAAGVVSMIALLLAGLVVVSPSATAAITVDAFIAKYKGKSVTDAVGNLPGECVSLIKRYHREVIGGATSFRIGNPNGKSDGERNGAYMMWDYYSHVPELKSHYAKVAKSSSARKGDLAVFSPRSSASPSEYGHVGIVTRDLGSKVEVLDQYNKHPKKGVTIPVPTGLHQYAKSALRGYLRPTKFATPAKPATSISTSKWYKVQIIRSGKYVDVAGARTANGTKVQQATSNTSYAQHWKFVPTSGGYFKVISRLNSTSGLDVKGHGTANKSLVHLWGIGGNGGTNQQWKPTYRNGSWQLSPRHAASKCLDNTGSTKNGAQLWLWTCSATNSNQSFKLWAQ